MSTINQLAIAGYLVLALPCLGAAFMALRSMPDAAHARRWWFAAAGFLAMLALIRAAGLEDLLREIFRQSIEHSGQYAQRRDLQAPFAVAGLVGLGLMPFMAWRFFGRKRVGPALALVRIAQLGMLGFVPLMLLRIVSLHATDRLLYRGPLRMNWLLEGGLCLAIGGAAALFMLHCLKGRRTDQRRGR